MQPDDKLCYCFHVTQRKVQNFLRIHRPRVPSEISECGGAGTGCGWCVPFLKKLFDAARSDQIAAIDESADQYAENLNFTIYPNPSNGKLTVEFQNGHQAPLFVYNQLGQLMISTDSNQLDLTPLNSGIYFISSPNYSDKVYKVIKL